MADNKAVYKRSYPADKGLAMVFSYRGYEYEVIRAFTYPESERDQHIYEQNKIDKIIKQKEAHQKLQDDGKLQNAQAGLDAFFKYLEDDED